MIQGLLAVLLQAGIAGWDTGKPLAGPLDPAAFSAKAGWTAIARDQTPEFKGDAVITNGRIVLAVRRDGAAELCSADGTQRSRIVLQAAGGDPSAKLERAKLVENNRGGAALEISCKTAKGASLAGKLRLKRGEVSVEVEPGAGAAQARLEAPCRFLVLPDFFADDIVVDASKVPLASAEIPSENFVLHMAGTGEAIVMGAFENREQDVRISIAGEGAERRITGSEIQFGKKGGKVSVALIEAPKVWHVQDVQAGDAGKVIPLDWKMPFPAQWRCTFTRSDDLAHSWDVLYQEKEGGDFQKPKWGKGGASRVGPDRKFWMGSFLYSVTYPCWTDAQGKGFLQPLKNRLTYKGPALIFPLNRLAQTPTEVFTVVDVVRTALGQGPCEYILDLESQKAELKGRATCSVRDELAMIYKAGEQKQRRADVERFLQQGVDFVKHIRGRIEGYLELQRGLKEYLAAQKKARPELADPIGQLEKILREIDGQLDDRKDKIKTPDDVVKMTDEFRKTLLDYTGPDAFDKVKQYSEALVEIGGNQDDLVARCRWAIKSVRARAGLLMTQVPAMAPIAEEIRTRTQKVLRNPAVHEEASRQ